MPAKAGCQRPFRPPGGGLQQEGAGAEDAGPLLVCGARAARLTADTRRRACGPLVLFFKPFPVEFFFDFGGNPLGPVVHPLTIERQEHPVERLPEEDPRRDTHPARSAYQHVLEGDGARALVTVLALAPLFLIIPIVAGRRRSERDGYFFEPSCRRLESVLRNGVRAGGAVLEEAVLAQELYLLDGGKRVEPAFEVDLRDVAADGRAADTQLSRDAGPGTPSLRAILVEEARHLPTAG